MLALSCVTQKDRGKEGAHGGGIFVKPGVWPCGVGAKSLAVKKRAYFLRCPVEKALRRTDGIQWRQENPPPPPPLWDVWYLPSRSSQSWDLLETGRGVPRLLPALTSFLELLGGLWVCLCSAFGLAHMLSSFALLRKSRARGAPALGVSCLGGELRGPSLREPGCQGGASRTGLSKEAGSVAASLASSSGISCGCEQVAV